MLRIRHTVSTIAVVLATAGLIAPAAQAKADGLPPHVAPKTSVYGIWDYVPQTGDRGAWVHDTPLANPVEQSQTAVNGRVASTGGGIDWTFPIMGGVALALIMMILGEQVLVRRGRLAT
jgi:hypothetical protein